MLEQTHHPAVVALFTEQHVESLADISNRFLDEARGAKKTSAADLIWAEALNVDADLQATLDKDPEALALARQAKEAALSLTQTNSNAQEPLQTLYDASIRIGNALSALGKAHNQEALQEYNEAIGVAAKIASLSGDQSGDLDVIDAHMKIGDVYKESDAKQHPQALAEYQSGLRTCEAALAKRPDSFDLLRDKGKTFFRIGELKRAEDAFDDARAFYRQAAEIQEALIARNAKEALASNKAPDLTLKSNLAATDTHWGMLERKAGDLNLALTKLRQGVKLNEELINAEPGNLQWVDYAAPSYRYIAEILDQLDRPKEALTYYHQFSDAKRSLAFRGLGPPKAREEFAEAAKLLGDHSTGPTQIDAYRGTVRIWSRLIDDPKAADLAAGQYDLMLGLAKFFDGKKDWPDAQTAYRSAQKIATLNLAKDPSNTSWRDKADAAGKAAVEAEQAAEAARPDAPH